MSRGGVDELVHIGKWKAVLRAGSVQIGVIHAHALLPIRFLHKDHVGEPIRVGDLPDETDVEEFVHLLCRCLLSFWSGAPFLLPHGSASRLHLEPVGHDFRIDPRHVDGRSGEDIHVGPKELDQSVPFERAQAGADLHG